MKKKEKQTYNTKNLDHCNPRSSWRKTESVIKKKKKYKTIRRRELNRIQY